MGGTYRRKSKIIKIVREIKKYECGELALYWKHVEEERMNTLSLGKSLARGERIWEIIFAIPFSLRTEKHVYLLRIGGMVIDPKRTIKIFKWVLWKWDHELTRKGYVRLAKYFKGCFPKIIILNL